MFFVVYEINYCAELTVLEYTFKSVKVIYTHIV